MTSHALERGPFDVAYAVDFSSASRPTLGPNSLWIHRAVDGEARGRASNHATRQDALDHLGSELTRDLDGGLRVLVGVDFALGYPAGFHLALGAADTPHPTRGAQTQAFLAERVVDDALNVHNRDALAASLNEHLRARASTWGIEVAWGPFWGGSARQLPPALPRRRLAPQPWPGSSAPIQLQALRATDRAMAAHTGRAPCSVFQLAYSGAVGGQTLLGIGWLDRLERRLGRPLHRWPFDAGPPDSPAVTVAEIYPSMFLPPARVLQGIVDEAQVRAWTAWWWAQPPERQHLLLRRPPSTDSIPWDEEGWTLGLPIPDATESLPCAQP